MAFERIAPFYDQLMANVPYRMWLEYYLLLLVTHRFRPHRLLDACCGTGTMTELLAEQGFSVAGFDLSPAMIERARAKAAARSLPIAYHVADARNLDLGERFEGIACFFDSLNYITEVEGFRRAIAALGRHLEPGGSLIFDLNTAYAFEARLFDQRDLRKNAPVRYEWKGHYDPATRLIRVEMDFEFRGELVREVHVQRAHTLDEVEEALVDAGLELVAVYESYTLDRPRPRSDRIHVVAVKS